MPTISEGLNTVPLDTGSRGRRAVRYYYPANHMGFQRLRTELWPPGPVTFLTQEPLESEQKGGRDSNP